MNVRTITDAKVLSSLVTSDMVSAL
jgi:hypothetical protein